MFELFLLILILCFSYFIVKEIKDKQEAEQDKLVNFKPKSKNKIK